MSATQDRIYNSKLLLFGEYGVLAGSSALSVPFHKFSGKLVIPDRIPNERTTIGRSNKILKVFRDYLQNSCRYEVSEYEFRFDLLNNDLENGLHFESNIPNGYGIGSSGALTAAIFDGFSTWHIGNNSLSDLKIVLGKMESFFHSKSSGMDPLTSLIDNPILVGENGQLSVIKSTDMPSDPSIYLIDSGKKGKTGDYVSNFLLQLQNPDFRKEVIEPYVNNIKICIESFLANEKSEFYANLKLLSEHQYNHFLELIPTQIRRIWKYGLNNDHFYLKLCGSGGGGFALTFLRDKEFNITEYLNRESIRSIQFSV